MKKIFLTLVLFFGISVSSSIHAYADDIATDESGAEQISNESLSDEVIDSLTIDDFVKAYEISSSDEEFKDLSEDDQNLYMIKLYNDIYESKSYRVTARYLPSAYENLNSAEKSLSNHILRKQHKCILLLVWLQKEQMHYTKTGCIMETEMLLDILIGMLRWQRC